MKAKEFLDLFPQMCMELQEYHSLFYQLAIAGEPIITDQVPTAAVSFDRKGSFLSFLFNEEFLEKLSWQEIKFICCHEMLHVLLEHGIRAKDNLLNREIANIAMDVVINHSLIDNFGFLRGDLPYLDSKECGICLIDRVFKDADPKKGPYLEDRNFEYYYNKIAQNAEKLEVAGIFAGPNGGALDDHSGLPGLTRDELEKLLEEALGDKEKAKEMADKLQEHNSKEAGKGPGTELFNAIYKYAPKKRRWENIVASIRKTKIRMGEVDEYQWSKPERRFGTMPHNFLLPSVNETDEEGPSKWDLWLFQDVSGSCVSYYERFVKAARSIPTDVFNVKFHVFDDGVKEVSLKQNTYPCGGGTCFNTIEQYIQKNSVKKGLRYPRLVFVITDGYGTHVKPQMPKNWFWFLTENYKDYIPKECKTFLLKDFE